MAGRDHNHHHIKKNNSSLLSSSCCTSFLFLSLLLSTVSLLLGLSLFRTSLSIEQRQDQNLKSTPTEQNKICDYSYGKWIYNPTWEKSAARYDSTCKEIFKGWNCIASNKSNALDILNWRWKPNDCDLPQFDPLVFLQHYRDTNIGFVGDSLNRNMFVSLFCSLKRFSGEVKKWRPAGADRGFSFVRYNLTIAYHRTNLLARYGRWWAPSKFDPVKSPMLFFEKGLPVTPPVPPDIGLDMVLKHLVLYVEGRSQQRGKIVFFRTQSPRHFEGGDWNQGGSCQRLQPLKPQEVEEQFSVNNNGTNVETRLVNQHLYKALDGSSSIRILDITHMSEYRADAHPSSAGGKRHDDCMHWCLPGVTDTWNDLLIAHLNKLK